MVAHLTVNKRDGNPLFNTELISHGLVKSGHMIYIESWSRRGLRSAQLDPNDGGNWGESLTSTDGKWCPLYGFTLDNCQSPVVFIVGTGCLQGTKRSGNTLTFMYANADADTKFYCFDFMANYVAAGPFLKLYTTAPAITFNSLQIPMNVIAQVQAPAVGPWNGSGADRGRRQTPYLGGRLSRRSYTLVPGTRTPTGLYTAMDAIVDIPMTAGIEYAAFLPWSRFCGINDWNDISVNTYGESEGAYGRVGGISFMFGASGATTGQTSGGASSSAYYYQIPTIYPTALVIATTNLPFPYN